MYTIWELKQPPAHAPVLQSICESEQKINPRRTLKVHLNIHVVSFFELMHGWGLLQLLVIINYLVLFIEYAYQTLVVYPMLSHPCINSKKDTCIIFR
jgi:hypothetical protein